MPAAPGEMLRIGAVQLKVLAPKESALIPAPWRTKRQWERMALGEVMSFLGGNLWGEMK